MATVTWNITYKCKAFSTGTYSFQPRLYISHVDNRYACALRDVNCNSAVGRLLGTDWSPCSIWILRTSWKVPSTSVIILQNSLMLSSRNAGFNSIHLYLRVSPNELSWTYLWVNVLVTKNDCSGNPMDFSAVYFQVYLLSITGLQSSPTQMDKLPYLQGFVLELSPPMDS